MLTWRGAYSKLEKDASWNENIIVLMSKSASSLTCYEKGFGILGAQDQSITNTLWTNAKDSTLFGRKTTITGSYNNTTYVDAIIEIEGDNRGLPIWGDTRFENLTFSHNGT